jgi:protein-tyrosine phosphatase
MRYAVTFLLLGATAVAAAVTGGGWAWLWLWPGACLLAVGTGYAGAGPRVFGKRSDGSRAGWAILVQAPYLGVAWLIWWLLRRVRTEPCCHALAPDLFIGRRPRPAEMPAAVAAIVDLTCELSESAAVRRGRRYLCVPVLDGHVTSDGTFVALVHALARPGETTYVHCAEGRGRTGALAVALLLARGLATDVDSALTLARSTRPSLRLSRSQRAQLERLTPLLRSAVAVESR